MSEVVGRARRVARPPDHGCMGRGRPGPHAAWNCPSPSPNPAAWVKQAAARAPGRAPGLPGCDTGGSCRLPTTHSGTNPRLCWERRGPAEEPGSDGAHSASSAFSPGLLRGLPGSWSWARSLPPVPLWVLSAGLRVLAPSKRALPKAPSCEGWRAGASVVWDPRAQGGGP